ncbi:MAG: ABC transporter ATP-binding protein [Armatimonadota bacterium]|nr:ABC transporter ATP-binding protein [Armatimonadota bacterium]
MSEYLFELSNAEYDYPTGQKALSGIDLAIRKGERLAVLGANASGKSTLLHILDGLYFALSGTVKAFGQMLTEEGLRDLEFRRFFRSEVGLVFQNVDAQLFSASVEEDLAFGPLQLGLSDDEVRSRIEGAAHLCGVESLMSRPPHALSGGEKKRVALASVLAVNPSILLLDEPTAGLDPRTEIWLIEALDQLAAEGKTLVISTHDLGFAAAFADRAIAIAEDHTLAAQGTPEQILSDYELLLRLNLIHPNAHRHGLLQHAHPHLHSLVHEHEHEVER